MSFAEIMKDPKISSALRNVLGSGGARIVILPLSGLAVLLSTRLMTGEYGTEAYALFALVASLPFLVPVADLGLGAAVTNAAAALPGSFENFKSTLAKASRVLWSTASILVVVAILLSYFGVWSFLLQIPDSRSLNWAVGAAMSIFALSVPGSLGARMLLGMRRNTSVVLIQGMSSVVSLVIVGVAVVLHAPVAVVVAISTVGMFATTWTLRIYGNRLLISLTQGHLSLDTSVGVVTPRTLMKTAVPMLIISLALPLTFQTGRIVLSWVVDLNAVAIYSAAAMVFLPALSVVSMAGRSLWGDFARGRHNGDEMTPLFVAANLICLAIGISGAVAFAVLGPFVARWGTNGVIETPHSLFYGFAAIILLQSIQQPSGMYLTDIHGLRFQAVTTVISGVVGLGISVSLSSRYGVIGPVLATVLALSVLHVAPCFLYSLIRLRSGKSGLPSSRSARTV